MVDVLELARQARAELVAELKKLDWFLEQAEVLLREHPQASAVKPATEVNPMLLSETVAPRQSSATMPDSEPAEKLVPSAKAPEEGKAAQVYQRPVDTIVFKKMLSEMRRTHEASDPAPVQEKVAATG